MIIKLKKGIRKEDKDIPKLFLKKVLHTSFSRFFFPSQNCLNVSVHASALLYSEQVYRIIVLLIHWHYHLDKQTAIDLSITRSYKTNYTGEKAFLKVKRSVMFSITITLELSFLCRLVQMIDRILSTGLYSYFFQLTVSRSLAYLIW